MMQAHIAHEFAVRHPDGSELQVDDLHLEGERLMEALLDLEPLNDDVADVTTYSEADRHRVVVEMLVTAPTVDAAFSKSMHVIRTAVHAIGGATPNWDRPAEERADYEQTNSNLAVLV